jgi:hypothetical protein
MSIKHVFELRNLPNFKEPTPITVVIPANAGSVFMTEVDIPESYLSDPMQLIASPVASPGSLSPSRTTSSLMSSPGRSPSMGSQYSQTSPFRSASPERTMSTQVSSLSPERVILSPSTTAAGFLPSITDRTGSQESSPTLVSRNTLSINPLREVSPRGSSPSATMPSSESSLAQQFMSSPRTVSTLDAPPITIPMRSTPSRASRSPESMSPREAQPSSFRELLTSPKMMSPKKFSQMKSSPTRSASVGSPSTRKFSSMPIVREEEPQMETAHLSMYRCSLDEDGGECEQIY